MNWMSAAESPVFVLGALLGASLLCAGILCGALLARWDRRGTDGIHPRHVLELLRELGEWTTGMAHHVAEFHEIVDDVDRQIRPEADSQRDGTSPQKPLATNELASSPWLKSLIDANQRLKQQLQDAEAALKQQTAEMASMVSAASTDPLTGLPNRRVFETELKRRFAEWRRHGTPFSVMVVDVDHFKKINDTYGHLVGDRVLRDVAGTLQGTMRETDVVTRFGGEEFAVILPSTGAGEAEKAAERARAAIERNIIRQQGQVVRVTVSCGVAHATTEDIPERIVERADKALYASKEAGRNVAYWHDGRQCVPVQRCVTVVDRGSQDPPATSLGQNEDFLRLCRNVRRRFLEVVSEADNALPWQHAEERIGLLHGTDVASE